MGDSMNDVYNYSNNINNNGNPTLPKKSNTGIVVVITLILVAVVTFLVFGLVKDYKKEEPPESDPVIEIKSYDSIKNYSFSMNLDYIKDNNVNIGVIGVANISKNIEEINFVYNLDTYYIYTDYSTGKVFVYDTNNTLLEEKKTTSKYTLNLEDIINKIRSDSDDVVDFNDGHYSVKIDLSVPTSSSVYADVYTENGYITEVKYDLTNILRNDGYSKYNVSFKLYNYNNKDLM